jgi:hypothetical protein
MVRLAGTACEGIVSPIQVAAADHIAKDPTQIGKICANTAEEETRHRPGAFRPFGLRDPFSRHEMERAPPLWRTVCLRF